jgi:hypothetical protein
MFPTLAIGVGEAINLGIAVPFRLAPLRTLSTATVPLVKVTLIWKETPSAIEDCAGMRHTPVTPAFTPDGKGPENQVSLQADDKVRTCGFARSPVKTPSRSQFVTGRPEFLQDSVLG